MAGELGRAFRLGGGVDDAGLDMSNLQAKSVGFDAVPELAPIVGTQQFDGGWRGVTSDGEILTVTGATIPQEEVTVIQDGHLIGRRIVNADVIDVSGYLTLFIRATHLHKNGCDVEALAVIDAAIAIADTSRARFNRSMILLALGRWPEGFVEYKTCERHPPFQRGNSQAAIAAGIKLWHGEPIAGKRLLLVHDHGLGDTLMMLRYIPVLRAAGADVVAWVPPELFRLVSHFAMPVSYPCHGADYFVPFLHLLRWLEATTTRVPSFAAVALDPDVVARWCSFPASARRRVGVAWSVSCEHVDDFPRSLPLADLLSKVDGDAEIHSVQLQNADEAKALGVATYQFEDLADCAVLMSKMDEIVTVDTAAVHLACVTGHPNVRLLLSRWHSWRWKFGSPFYPNIRIEASGR